MDVSLDTFLIDSAPTYVDGARYLKTMFRGNRDRTNKRFFSIFEQYMRMNEVPNWEDWIKFYWNLWDKVKPFSYKEAFELTDENFRMEVFATIDVPQMVKELGHTRIKTAGIKLKDRHFNPITREFEEIELDQVYELHKVDGSKLIDTEFNGFGSSSSDLYALRCWCTSTNEEHWLWLENDASNDPLQAVASTCRIYEGMRGKIKHIIRQGDVYLFEMLDGEYIPEDNEATVPLDKNTYFSLLKSQS